MPGLGLTVFLVHSSALAFAHENEGTVFQVSLTGGQMSPPVATADDGEGFVFLDFNTGRLNYEGTLSGMSGTFVVADFRVGRLGGPGFWRAIRDARGLGGWVARSDDRRAQADGRLPTRGQGRPPTGSLASGSAEFFIDPDATRCEHH